MTMHLLLLGFIGAISGVLAIVANQRTEPFYSWLIHAIPSVRVNYVPEIKRLYSARQAIAEGGAIHLRFGFREELQTIHEILAEEYGFDEQYYPVELKIYHNSIEMEYADKRTNGRRETNREDLLELFDSRISKKIGRAAASLGIIAVAAFAILIILTAV